MGAWPRLARCADGAGESVRQVRAREVVATYLREELADDLAPGNWRFLSTGVVLRRRFPACP